MVSTELELAQKYAALTRKIRATKREELQKAKDLVAQLEKGLATAEQDCVDAVAELERVEKRLEIVEIDGAQTEDSVTSQPRAPSPTLLETSPGTQLSSRSREVLTEVTSTPIPVTSTIPASLRRSLGRHARTIRRRSEHQHSSSKRVRFGAATQQTSSSSSSQLAAAFAAFVAKRNRASSKRVRFAGFTA